MFRTKCENCGHKDSFDKFLVSCIALLKFRCMKSITLKCPVCDFKYRTEYPTSGFVKNVEQQEENSVQAKM